MIPFYKEINEFLESIPSIYRTGNPDFFCLRIKENDELAINNYKPPFRKDFYFIALVSHAGHTKITYDQTDVSQMNSFLVFQSPGLVYSFQRDPSARGYLVYFKRSCFSFFKPDLEVEFPYFDFLQTNFFKLNYSRFSDFAPLFEEVFTSYESSPDACHKVASVKLLALLYQLREFTLSFKQWEDGFNAPQHILFKKYVQLVNNFYIEKRTVAEYAALLNVTPNHLSQQIKSVSGKNALSFVNERLIAEAKSLIQYTSYDMAEIGYMLNFSDPANFGKFFRKNTGQSPMAFRKSKLEK